MSLSLRAEPLDLELARPFTISRGTRTHAHNVRVRVEQDGTVGWGECAPNPRYSQSPESALGALLDFGLPYNANAMEPLGILEEFDVGFPQESAARAGLSMALWDWFGKRQGLPLCRMLGIDPSAVPPSSFTISIDDAAAIVARVREADAWPVLKVKMGGGDDDVRAIEALREATAKPFRVDANEAWDEAEAAEKIRWLAGVGCELVEQPLPAGQLDATQRLREDSPLPLVADEDAQAWEDLEDLTAAYTAVNVKLAKCGGIREAVHFIHRARTLGLEVMVGCMIEDNVGIAAAAHLSPLCRWADLDGAELLAAPASGPRVVENGTITIPRGPGLGVQPL